jgi:sporulation protein YlmC with PRC-barrel domain
MSPHEVSLHHLLGRPVYDEDGRSIGRLEELIAEIEVHGDVSEYVVREYHVGAYAFLEALAGAHFARYCLRLLRRGYQQYSIPWDWVDLSDPARPRVTRRVAELARI